MSAARTILLVEANDLDLDSAQLAFEARALQDDLPVTRGAHEALESLRREGAFTRQPEGDPSLMLDHNMPRESG